MRPNSRVSRLACDPRFSSAKRRPWMMPDQTSAFIIFVHVRATFDLSHVRGLARIPFCRLADVFNVEGGKERSKHFHVSPPMAVAPLCSHAEHHADDRLTSGTSRCVDRV